MENWEKYKQKKNEVKKLLSSAKEEYIQDKLDKCEGNPKKNWSTINNISGLGKNKNSRKCTKLVDEMGKVYENLEAAEFLNNH